MKAPPDPENLIGQIRKDIAMRKLPLVVMASMIGGAALFQAPSASAQVSIQFRVGTPDRPLRGRQFETMRALAHYLDESAKDAADSAGSNVRGRSRSTRQFLASLNDFSRRADSFHERMDNYEARPWDLPREVVSLDRSARQVNDTIRRTRLYYDVREDWGQVVDVLDRMKRLLAGEDVRVPPAHRHGGDYDRDYGPFSDNRDDGHVGHGEHDSREVRPSQPNLLPPDGDPRVVIRTDGFLLVGPRMEQYRQLAHQLDEHVSRTMEIVGRVNRDGRDYSQDLFLSLQQFNTEARTLHNRTDSGQLDTREMRPTLNRLLVSAQDTDRRMRETNVFPRVWEEWRQTIAVLNQMAELVR